MIYGAIICQDGMPEILRAIESIAFADLIYVVDGGSKDGTLEYLENIKELYKLRIYKRRFDTMKEQRNYLLRQLPSTGWVVGIDQDEALSVTAKEMMPQFLNSIGTPIYDRAEKEKLVVTLDIPFYNLRTDFRHYRKPMFKLRNKIFLYRPGIEYCLDYHCEPSYDCSNLSQYIAIPPPEGFAIFHYSWFDPKKNEKRRERLKKLGEDGENELKIWFGDAEIGLLPPNVI